MTYFNFSRLRLFAVLFAALFISSCGLLDSTDTAASSETILSNEFLTDSACVPSPIRFADTLKLSSDQISRIKFLEDSLRANEDSAIKLISNSRDSIRIIMDQFRAARKAAIEGILTADQLALLKSLRPTFTPGDSDDDRDDDHDGEDKDDDDEDGGRHKDGHHGGCNHKNFEARDSVLLERITIELGLTSAQVTQIASLQATIRSSKPTDPKAVLYEGLKGILTSEQLVKLDVLMAAFPPKVVTGP